MIRDKGCRILLTQILDINRQVDQSLKSLDLYFCYVKVLSPLPTGHFSSAFESLNSNYMAFINILQNLIYLEHKNIPKDDCWHSPSIMSSDGSIPLLPHLSAPSEIVNQKNFLKMIVC